MSELVESRYEGDEQPGIPVFLVKVSQAVLDFRVDDGGTNRGSARDVVYPFHVNANAKRSGGGLHCRGVLITWDEPAPDGYDDNGKLFIPIMRPFLIRRAKLHGGCTYMSRRAIIIGKRPEIIR